MDVQYGSNDSGVWGADIPRTPVWDDAMTPQQLLELWLGSSGNSAESLLLGYLPALLALAGAMRLMALLLSPRMGE